MGAPRSRFLALVVVLAVAVGALAWRLAGPSRRSTRAEANAATPARAQGPLPELSPESETARGRAEVAVRPPPEDASDAAARAEADPAPSPCGIHLTGTVKARDGVLLLARGGVGLVDSDGNWKRCELEEARYSFSGLSPGEYTLGAGAWGYRGLERSISLRAEEPEAREDLVLDPLWMLAVRILTPEGEDLRDLLREESLAPGLQLVVIATPDPPGERLPASFLMERSSFGVGRSQAWWLPGETRDDRLAIDAEPPLYVSVAVRDIVLETKRVDGRIPALTFTIDVTRIRNLLAGLTFLLVDADTGEPVPEAWVSLATEQSTERAIHPDSGGRVTFETRVPGLYEAHVFVRDHVFQSLSADLEPGRVTDLGTIRVVRAVAIRGRCVDVEGRLHKVRVCFEALRDESSSSPEPFLRFGAEPEGEDGGFVIRNLSAGRFIATTDPAPGAGESELETGWTIVPTSIDTRRGPVEDLVLVVHRPVALVLRPASEAVEGMSFAVLTPTGVPDGSGGFGRLRTERLELAPGDYTLRLSRSGALVREVPFTIAGETLRLTVEP